mmetsp:Transcript_41107/g.101418  ORF Transcript_41107/g.101418 Transcript_41107/m.101418 type:complete len:144 (-) Transcript_41107:727-1158(-)
MEGDKGDAAECEMAETYGFDHSEEEERDDEDMDIENQYYSSKGLVVSDASEALSGFREVVRMGGDTGDWGFKALKQIVKLQLKLRNYESVRSSYREMLSYIKSADPRNLQKVILKIFEHVSTSGEIALLQVQCCGARGEWGYI